MRALSGDFQPWVDFFAFISAEEFFITGVNQIDLSGRKFKEKQTIALGGDSAMVLDRRMECSDVDLGGLKTNLSLTFTLLLFE